MARTAERPGPSHLSTQANSIILALIIALSVLLLSAFALLAYICTQLLAVVQITLSRIESSQTTQQQYMYMMRGDVNEINNDLTHFFVVNGYENMMSIRRREQLQRERSRGPPSVGDI